MTNRGLTEAIVTYTGQSGDWTPVRAVIDGETRTEGLKFNGRGRLLMDGRSYHIEGVLGQWETSTGWIVEAQFVEDGYNVLLTYAGHTEPQLERPVSLERAVFKARELATKNLMGLGTVVMCTVVPQDGLKRVFGNPVAVCDANGTSRAMASYMWLHGEMLPVTYIEDENAGEAATSPAQLTGTAASDNRQGHYTAPLAACQAML